MRSVRGRLALVLAVVGLVPGLIALLTIGWLAPRQDDRAALQLMRQSTQAVADSFRSQCLALGESARLLAAQLRGNDVDAAVLAAVQRQQSAFAVLYQQDQLVAQAGTIPSGDVADVSCSRDSSLGSNADPVIAETVPAVDDDGTQIGTAVVGRVLDSAALTALVTSLGLPEGTQLAVACSAGPGVTTSSGSFGEQLERRAVAAAGGEVTQGGISGNQVDARRVLTGSSCGVSAAVKTADSGSRLGVLGVVMVACLALGLFLVLRLAASLTRPISALTDAAERVSRGDLSSRLPRGRDDELGRLSSSFNVMTDQLARQIGELQRSRDLLRQNVSQLGDALERTHDLDGLLRTVVSAALSATNSQRGSVWLVEGASVVARATEPKSSPPAAVRREPLGSGLAGEVAHDGVPRRVGVGMGGSDLALGGPALAAPLRRGQVPIGVLVVERDPTQPPFDSEAEAMLVSLAGPAGIAVDNVKLHREAQKLSVTDPLTGAGNLRYMTTTLAREVERASRFGRPLSVLLLDLDHFKRVNDTYGHTVGDGVLQEMSRRLAACVREVDVVCRYGGEEFVVVAPETSLDGAEHLADRICDSVRAEAFMVGEDQVEVTVSVGVASLPTHGTASGDLVRAADDGLYQAKRAGRDCWRVAEQPAQLSSSSSAESGSADVSVVAKASDEGVTEEVITDR
ncbi:MAG: diguanylate cyclase [Actinomycetota bacterium]